ncbi:MAG: hypothetical protein WC661_02905 [Opitutaceae bacterium]|jgi:hypothetical protein
MTPVVLVADWTEIVTPPKPYLHALRRSFPNGLHVLVLTQEAGGKFQVLSSVDHGTPRGTLTNEGESSDPAEVAGLIAQTCERWNTPGATGTASANGKQRRYYYGKPAGGISGAVSRDDLFALIAHGTISWDSQVWEDTEGLAESGRWRPITASLGFPQETDVI